MMNLIPEITQSSVVYRGTETDVKEFLDDLAIAVAAYPDYPSIAFDIIAPMNWQDTVIRSYSYFEVLNEPLWWREDGAAILARFKFSISSWKKLEPGEERS